MWNLAFDVTTMLKTEKEMHTLLLYFVSITSEGKVIASMLSVV